MLLPIDVDVPLPIGRKKHDADDLCNLKTNKDSDSSLQKQNLLRSPQIKFFVQYHHLGKYCREFHNPNNVEHIHPISQLMVNM